MTKKRGKSTSASAQVDKSSLAEFDVNCRACPRLSHHLESQRGYFPSYHNLPVAPFGPSNAEFMIVGLAPGMHGANRTGRPFTGDYAGVLLFETLHKFGFANQALGTEADDGLQLINCRITNAVKCLPPQNKPDACEIRTCNRYLARELASCRPRVVLALGLIAHDATMLALGEKRKSVRFKHGAMHVLPDSDNAAHRPVVFDSYHCSRYNTQTRRLTTEMFQDVIGQIRRVVDRTG
jgi:uracil-DNA glycosylase family 4